MITLEGETLILDRTQGEDDVLPLIFTGKEAREQGWFIDIAVVDQSLLYLLIDLEVLDDEASVRYIARNGQTFSARMHIAELISGPEEGNLCRLRGNGKPPDILLADGALEMNG